MRCVICKIDKTEDDFAWENKVKQKRANRCKICQRQLSKNHYKYNKSIYLQNSKEQRIKGHKFIDTYLHSCVDCGESDIRILDFDHQKDKKSSIAHLSGCSFKTLQEEIVKCEVRCGNCHRRKTLQEQNSFKYCFMMGQKKSYCNSYREIKMNFIISYLEIHPCIDCGEKDILVLEFDHFEKKKYNISRFMDFGLETLKIEIEKCEIRCVNCHRKKHIINCSNGGMADALVSRTSEKS